MADIRSGAVSVSSTGRHSVSVNGDYPILVKNVGPVTVYLGRAFAGNTDPVDTATSYPLAPGESAEFPAVPPNGNEDNYVLAANTIDGTSQLRFIGREGTF